MQNLDHIKLQMEDKMDDVKAALNTDKEIWREREGDAYADSIHVTKDGEIGIDCGGYVIIKPIRAWHEFGSEKTNLTPANAGEALGALEHVAYCLSDMMGGEFYDFDEENDKPSMNDNIQTIRAALTPKAVDVEKALEIATWMANSNNFTNDKYVIHQRKYETVAKKLVEILSQGYFTQPQDQSEVIRELLDFVKRVSHYDELKNIELEQEGFALWEKHATAIKQAEERND